MIKIIFGYLIIAFSGVLFLSLISFSPLDSSFFTSSYLRIPQNIAGKIGVFLSSIFITMYGKFASYILNFGFFSMGINLLTNKKIGKVLTKFILFFISAISLSIALSAISKNPDFIRFGISGTVISNLLGEFLPKEFIFILFLSLFLISLISSMKLFRSFTSLVGKALIFIFVFPFNWILSSKRMQKNKTSHQKQFDFPDVEIKEQPEKKEDQNISVKEPEFLKKQDVVFEKTALKESVPAWIIDRNEKEKVLNKIKKLPVEEEISNQPEEKMRQIKEAEETNMPVPILEESIEENSIVEEEEITGEADYREIIAQREKDEEALSYIPENKLENYIFPAVEELEKSFKTLSHSEEETEIKRVSEIIETTFASFRIDVKVSGYSRGPSITRYEILPPDGLKLKSIVNLTDDLALKLGTKHLRIVAPIGNKSIIGIEVPNQIRDTVVLREIIESENFKKSKAILPLILGKDIAGNIIIEDLTEMPHLLIAGTTGSGKSVFVNSLIAGIVFRRTSDEVKFILIDPKMVELELYDGIPHLLSPVITSPEEAIAVLEWVSEEMDNRYNLLSEAGVRNIIDYNKEISINNLPESEKLPFIVIIIDEFANLMLRLPKETEKIISRLAAMARATGIHLVVATQRPSVDVVTGIIKANFPSRIAFRVSSQTDSRTILDRSGAEKLLGKGDLLFMTPNFIDLIRIQAPFVSIRDVETIVKTLKRNGEPEYVINPTELLEKETEIQDDESITDYTEDPLFKECLRVATENGEVSASFLQRRFRIGYNRASRIIEAMDRMKILGPSKGSGKPREVLITPEELRGK
ncbi:MAG: DNA translocase FtsK 4TM domain-containing protein [Brevinematia bacterium]